MAAAPRKFIAALVRHGLASEDNKTDLETWKSEALAAIAENKGSSPLSGSANGISFAFGGNSMTISEWFTALDEALVYVEAGIKPPTTTFARIL